MKNIKNVLSLFLSLALLMSCQEDDRTIGEIKAPSNIEISATYIDDGTASAAPGLGSGVVEFTASATNATAFHFVIQGVKALQTDGVLSHSFTLLGTNTYAVTVIAYGTGGVSTSRTMEVEVLSLYDPPVDLLEMLHANSSRTWKIASEVDKHFGLGPVGGTANAEWYGAGPGDKVDTGMYFERDNYAISFTSSFKTSNLFVWV